MPTSLHQAFVLTITMTTASCALFGGGGGYTGPKDRPEPVAPSADQKVVELTVNNTTDADVCRLHVRESALHDAYGWSSNQLAERGNPTPIKAGTTATIKLHVNKPFEKPDVHALDCEGNTIMRVYDKPAFPNSSGATWTLARTDEGTIAAIQDARGIHKSVHPLNRKDPTPAAGGSIEISLENKCGATVEYCHQSTGSSTSSVNGNSSKRLAVSAGDTIAAKNGSSCGALIHTVSTASREQTVTLCK